MSTLAVILLACGIEALALLFAYALCSSAAAGDRRPPTVATPQSRSVPRSGVRRAL